MPIAKPNRPLYIRALLLLIAYIGLLGVGQLHALEHWDLHPTTHIHSTDGSATCPEDEHMPACQLCHSSTISTYSTPEVFRLSLSPQAEYCPEAFLFCGEAQGIHTLYLLRGPPSVR